MHRQKYTETNTKRLYFDTKSVIIGSWYKVNSEEDNFAIHINSKFHESYKFKTSSVQFLVLGTHIPENIFRKKSSLKVL